jgi:hypothetical protein
MPADGHRSAEVAFTNGEGVAIEVVAALGQEGEQFRLEQLGPEAAALVYRARAEPRAMVKLGSGPLTGDTLAWRSVLVVLPDDMESQAASFDYAGAVRAELVWLTAIGAVTGLSEPGIAAATSGLTAGTRYFTGEGVLDGMNCVLPGTCYRCAGAGSFTVLPAGTWGSQTAVDAADAWALVKSAAAAARAPCECAGQ